MCDEGKRSPQGRTTEQGLLDEVGVNLVLDQGEERGNDNCNTILRHRWELVAKALAAAGWHENEAIMTWHHRDGSTRMNGGASQLLPSSR